MIYISNSVFLYLFPYPGSICKITRGSHWWPVIKNHPSPPPLPRWAAGGNCARCARAPVPPRSDARNSPEISGPLRWDHFLDDEIKFPSRNLPMTDPCMYGIYGNINHQYIPNVSIYTIHGSYGYHHAYSGIRKGIEMAQIILPGRLEQSSNSAQKIYCYPESQLRQKKKALIAREV